MGIVYPNCFMFLLKIPVYTIDAFKYFFYIQLNNAHSETVFSNQMFHENMNSYKVVI